MIEQLVYHTVGSFLGLGLMLGCFYAYDCYCDYNHKKKYLGD